MGSYIIYNPRSIPPPLTSLQIQKAVLALLPLRSMLLRHHPQLHLHLVPTTKSSLVRRVLLSFPWIVGERCYHVAE